MATKKQKLTSFLEAGNTVTEKVAQSRFGIRSLRSTVASLRNDGLCVYTNYSNGVAQYRIGTPSRSMVEIAFRIAGTRVFGVRN